MSMCARCDAQIPEGGRFCIECGAPAEPATGATERLPEHAGGPQCGVCGTRNPAGADFCVSCGRALGARPLAEPPPAPGLPPMPAPLSYAPAEPPPMPARRMRPFVEWDGLTGGVWLIGLAVLFMTGWWWPGILVLIGLSSLLSGMARAQSPQARLGALQGAVWMIGIAVIAAFGWWWPGMLVLIGLSAIMGAVSFRDHPS